MTSTVPHVRKRGAIYQYERRVPKEVQSHPENFEKYFKSRPLFRRSLRTSDPTTMHGAAEAVSREFETLVALAKGNPLHLEAPLARPLRRVTETDLEAIQERYRDLTARPFENAYLRADFVDGASEELERMHYEMEQYAEELSDALKPGARKSPVESIDTPAEAAAFIVQNEGFDAAVGSPDFAHIVSAVRSGMKQGYERIGALTDGTALPRGPNATPKADGGNRITLSEAVKRYLDHKNLPAKTIAEVRLALRIFNEVIGDKALDKLTRDDFKRYVEHLAGLKVGGKSAGSIERPISSQTVKKRLSLLRSAITLAEHRGWYSGTNPAAAINVDMWVKPRDLMRMPNKRAFTVSELNRLFRHPWFTGCYSKERTHEPGIHRLQGAEYWAPIVALLTGCRASELGGLKIDEVRVDDEHPHIIVRDNEFRRTKSGYARYVPIVDALIDLGFRQYVHRIAKSGSERLFPDWEYPCYAGNTEGEAAWSNARIIRAFNRTVVPATLGNTLAKGARQEVTFHSLRGAFKTMLCSSRYSLHPNVIDDVIGHAKSKVEKAYSNIALEDAYRLIRGCTYEKLDIPLLPNVDAG